MSGGIRAAGKGPAKKRELCLGSEVSLRKASLKDKCSGYTHNTYTQYAVVFLIF